MFLRNQLLGKSMLADPNKNIKQFILLKLMNSRNNVLLSKYSMNNG